jgi:uncharacterized integral membrane protein
MIRKFVAILILVPLAALIVVFAVANRAPVTVSLDPFMSQPPMFAVSAPLFVIALVALIVGVIIGGASSWLRQAKWRRRARRQAAEIRLLRQQTEAMRRQLEAGAVAQAASISAITYRHPSAA